MSLRSKGTWKNTRLTDTAYTSRWNKVNSAEHTELGDDLPKVVLGPPLALALADPFAAEAPLGARDRLSRDDLDLDILTGSHFL